MEKALHLKSNGGQGATSAGDAGTSAAMKKITWQGVSEKVSCGIGEVQTYEHFGLPEMLYCLVAKNHQGEKGTSLPASCRYSAKHQEMVTRVLKISSHDFIKIMPKKALDELLAKYKYEYYSKALLVKKGDSV